MNMCEQIGFLKVIYIIKQLFNIIIVIIPLILTILIMIDITKSLLDNPDKIGDAINKSIKRFISAVIIFFVPTIVFAIYNGLSNNGYNIKLLCLESATSQNIKKLEANRQASLAKLRTEEQRAAEEMQRKQEQQRLIEEARRKLLEESQSQAPTNVVVPSGEKGSLTPIINGTQRALNPGDCLKWTDNCYCPDAGRLKGFQFIMKDSSGRQFAEVRGGSSFMTLQETCSDGSVIKVSINPVLKDNYSYALKQMCLLKTTGINGVKLGTSYLKNYGTVSKRLNSARTICSLHAYGSAIDINNSMGIDINGKTYRPYDGQGLSTKRNYNEFVSAIGNESDVRNTNYILWLYAFKPAGFTWGGTWSDAYFDPMHFEVT